MRSFPSSHTLVGAAAVLTLALAPLACSSDDGGSVAQTGEAGDGTTSTGAGAASRLVPPEEFEAVIAVPFDDIESSADQLPTDKGATLAIYCRSGNMSADAAVDLAAMGYTDVVDLEGGMVAWEAAGLELIDDPANADS